MADDTDVESVPVGMTLISTVPSSLSLTEIDCSFQEPAAALILQWLVVATAINFFILQVYNFLFHFSIPLSFS